MKAGLAAVPDVDIQVNQGETVSIIGPNGARKATVFNMITDFYRPDHVKILLDGRKLFGLKPYTITRAVIARTLQNIRLFAD